MATIALYAGRINQVSGQVSGAKKAVGSLKTQLDTLKKKCEKVNASVCNIDDVIRSISASTRTQEAKAEMLETLGEDIEQFVKDTAQIDENVADVIDTGKDNFYDQYSHVKPDCEKTMWEKFKKGMKTVGEWCKDHWKAVVAIALVVAAVVIIVLTAGSATPVSLLLLGAAKGILINTVIGAAANGLVGGYLSALKGEGFAKGFWEGAEDGAFGGAIAGMFAGFAGAWFQYGMKIGTGFSITSNATKVAKLSTVKIAGIGAGSEGASTFIGGLAEMIFGEKDVTLTTVTLEAVWSAVLGALGGLAAEAVDWSPVIRGITKGKGSWAYDWCYESMQALKGISGLKKLTVFKSLWVDVVSDVPSYTAELGKNLLSGIHDLLRELVKSRKEAAAT